MLVALTGTPGTGKTSTADLLEQKGYHVIRLNILAQEQGFLDGFDKKRKTKLMDMTAMNNYVKKTYKTRDLVFFEGHAAHLLSVDYVILLRCHPDELKNRLQTKKWNSKKILENIEAEALDVILCEAVDNHPEKNIFEIDTTQHPVDSIVFAIEEIIQNNFQPIKKYTIGTIDWSEDLFGRSPS
ncbi:MAG: adenylate kinase family protein [Euryarchaeota archaeon]|nr:adenylate kinase family protein [Euryarchaeota archaeon]